MASTPSTHLENSPKKKRAKLTRPHGAFEEFYSGDNWEFYSAQLKLHFSNKNVPEDKQVSILLAVLSPAMYEVLRDLSHPELPQHKTYTQLSKILERHYAQEALVLKERIKFHEAVQADNESVTEWLTRVKNLAVFCEFGKQLDGIMKDKFVSGLLDQRIVSRLCKEINDKGALKMRYMVDVAVEMERYGERQGRTKWSASWKQNQPKRISSRITNIVDIPDEILVNIVSYLNARERVPLGNSCQKFNSLVFSDETLLRDLDFSKNGHLTSMSDIREYFSNENTRKHVRRVNMTNVNCLRTYLLNDTIGRATNLVDVHIHGIEFRDIWQLGSFLNQLPHVRRLSIDWHLAKENDFEMRNNTRHLNFDLTESDVSLCKKVLQKSFSKLTYLSVHVKLDLFRLFLFSLQLCHELRELRMELEPLEVEDPLPISYTEFRSEELTKLTNLKVVEYWGPLAVIIETSFVKLLMDLHRWTEFQMSRSSQPYRFYLEKDIHVCKELMGGEWMQRVPNPEWRNLNLGWALFPECFLYEVLKITCENVPDKFCCLSTFSKGERCLLTINDIHRLLEDPGHQVSELHMNHDIERGCDVHLIASVFPSLTKLYLSNVIRSKEINGESMKVPIEQSHHIHGTSVSTRNEPHSERRLRRKGNVDLIPEEQGDFLNLDSSFKMLIDHTPNVIHLTLHATTITAKDKCWDLDVLYLIPGWKNLEKLRLFFIPIENGDFLIEIGKQCKNLQQLMLSYLGGLAGCYKQGLFQMLPHCRNLKQFTIEQYDMGQVSKVIDHLSNNLELIEVRVKVGAVNDTIVELVSSIEQLLHRCPNLITFTCEMNYTNSDDYDQLSSAVQRWNSEFTRVNLDIQVDSFEGVYETLKIGTIHDDSLTPTSYSSYTNRRPNFP